MKYLDRESAESVAIAVKAQRLFVADGTNLAIHVISFNSTDSFSSVNMTYEDNIDISTISPEEQSLNITVHDITSIAWSSKDDLVIATIVPLNYAIESGYLLFIDPYNLMITNMIELIGCYLPDMVTTSNNNDTILIACEGEPDNNTISNPDYNPPGSISVIDIVMEDGADNAEYTVTNIGFLDFDEGGSKHKLLPNDTYLPHQNESFSVNAEPEYITCQWNDKYCYITLQENNLIAILEMENREIVNVQSLGIRDFSLYGLDASDRDNGINITRYPRLYGLRAPDALDYFQSVENRHYIITANEGDDKDFDVSRIEDMILDQNVFIGVSVDDLKQQQNLGRLKAINQLGLGQTAGIYEEMYISGSRDFTIYEIKHGDDGISTMSFVYSSKAEFEEVTAVKLGTDGFNGDGYIPSFDTRSDNKGPEPEGIAVGTCGNDRIYAFIGLERANGVEL